jgi:hypothetical protein
VGLTVSADRGDYLADCSVSLPVVTASEPSSCCVAVGFDLGGDEIRWLRRARADSLRYPARQEVLMMCMVPSEVAITATTCEFAAI